MSVRSMRNNYCLLNYIFCLTLIVERYNGCGYVNERMAPPAFFSFHVLLFFYPVQPQWLLYVPTIILRKGLICLKNIDYLLV